MCQHDRNQTLAPWQRCNGYMYYSYQSQLVTITIFVIIFCLRYIVVLILLLLLELQFTHTPSVCHTFIHFLFAIVVVNLPICVWEARAYTVTESIILIHQRWRERWGSCSAYYFITFPLATAASVMIIICVNVHTIFCNIRLLLLLVNDTDEVVFTPNIGRPLWNTIKKKRP